MNDDMNDKQHRTLRGRFAPLLLVGVTMFLVGSILGAFWQRQGQPVAHGNTTVQTPATQSANLESGSPQAIATPPVWPARYKDAAKQEIATELNLSYVQIKEKLSQPHVSLFEVTTEQGIPPDQVLPMWLNALQGAGNLMIKMGTWTPQQANSYWRYWSNQQASALGQKNMDAELSRWFLAS